MTGKHLLLAGLAAVSILAYTAYRFAGGEPVELLVIGEGEDAHSGGRESLTTAGARSKRAAKLLPTPRERTLDDPTAPPELILGDGAAAPGVPTPEEKLARFERAIERIDDNLSRSYEIDPRRKDSLYQDVTQAFDALSVHLNANDPEHLAYIELARKRMLERLRSMDIERSRVGDATPTSLVGRPR